MPLKAFTKTKTCQRVWLPQRTDEEKARAYNIVLYKEYPILPLLIILYNFIIKKSTTYVQQIKKHL